MMHARSTTRTTYHHGSLREAIAEAALAMIEERGEDGVNLREAARRAGVSSGAPFRHFADREDVLLAAVELAAQRLSDAMSSAAERSGSDPMGRFRAMGVAYVVWATAHPELFLSIHSRAPHRWLRSPALVEMERAQREGLEALVAGRGEGSASMILAGHALVHGLARMLVHGIQRGEPATPQIAEKLAIEVTGILGTGFGAPTAP
jgi:AcrR family transcriptional regulator